MFKKPVGVAGAIYIKGIGCGGMVGPNALSIRPAVREGNKRICAGTCCSKGAALAVASHAVEGV